MACSQRCHACLVRLVATEETSTVEEVLELSFPDRCGGSQLMGRSTTVVEGNRYLGEYGSPSGPAQRLGQERDAACRETEIPINITCQDG